MRRLAFFLALMKSLALFAEGDPSLPFKREAQAVGACLKCLGVGPGNPAEPITQADFDTRVAVETYLSRLSPAEREELLSKGGTDGNGKPLLLLKDFKSATSPLSDLKNGLKVDLGKSGTLVIRGSNKLYYLKSF